MIYEIYIHNLSTNIIDIPCLYNEKFFRTLSMNIINIDTLKGVCKLQKTDSIVQEKPNIILKSCYNAKNCDRIVQQ